MEDKTFQEALAQRIQILSGELTEQILNAINTYVHGLGGRGGKTFKQLTNHIENESMRTHACNAGISIYLATLIKVNKDQKIINQAQYDELIAFLGLPKIEG
jgi:hypothetical protein